LALSPNALSVRKILQYSSPKVFDELQGLVEEGFSGKQTGILLDTLATILEAEKSQATDNLVLSGPEVPGVPTADTSAVIHTLIEQAKNEIILVGYTVYKGEQMFRRLSERMQQNSDLRVIFCLDIKRSRNDTSMDSEVIARFKQKFRQDHWPFEKLPKLYFDPRSLTVGSQNSALHAKCVIADRQQALISSANFTEAAMDRNIEVGVLIKSPPAAARLAQYFEALISTRQLREVTFT